MFERLKSWFASFKNKVTTAMTFIGGIAATAALLPLPIPTWARIGLGVIAAAAPVVSVVHATTQFAKSKKAEIKTDNLVDALTCSATDDSLTEEAAEQKKEAQKAVEAEARTCTAEKVNGDDVNPKDVQDVATLVDAMTTDDETTNDVDAQEVKDMATLVEAINAGGDQDVAMSEERVKVAKDNIVDVVFDTENVSIFRNNEKSRNNENSRYGRNFDTAHVVNVHCNKQSFIQKLGKNATNEAIRNS